MLSKGGFSYMYTLKSNITILNCYAEEVGARALFYSGLPWGCNYLEKLKLSPTDIYIHPVSWISLSHLRKAPKGIHLVSKYRFLGFNSGRSPVFGGYLEREIIPSLKATSSKDSIL